MGKISVTMRLDEALVAEIDNYAQASGWTRSEAMESFLSTGLENAGISLERLPGWDAKAIARIALQHYGGMAGMFKEHKWPESGSAMMPKVQKRVIEVYGSVASFVEKHSGRKARQTGRH